MSWLNKILPPKIQVDESTSKSNVPHGLWRKCENCGEILYYTDLEHNFQVCPKCEHHHSLRARERIDMLLAAENREEIGINIKPKDILNFKDITSYKDKIEKTQKSTNENDALVVMAGLLENLKVVVAAFEFKFIGGSMGSVVGEKFALGVKYAYENNCPFICVTSSGGARMQEGLSSLMQMAKTCASLHLLNEKKLPFISVLADPTMGGVSASFAFLGDVVIAEPGARIGFAGLRVIEQTVREKLPDGFQRSEFLLKKGAIDLVIKRQDLKKYIYNILTILK